ncbi:MAG TPA: class I SAM-dependent methyltransferase [Acidimicrobiia bacterium]|nr:class I SAM-dependent methyltransferase [Acidimicrobiia bacterium]
MPEVRYEGVAAWYDEFASGFAQTFAAVLADRAATFANSGDVVVDVGCGTGLHFDALQALGLKVVGVDVSMDQLQIARQRSRSVVRGDGTSLPLMTGSIGLVVATFVHTDVDDFPAMLAEVSRVLQPGRRFIYLGTHPCFIGPFIKRTSERDRAELVIRPGYGHTELVFEGSGQAGAVSSLKAKVGSRNLPLAAFVSAFPAAHLSIEAFDELDTRARPWAPDPDDGTLVPWNVLVVAAKKP